MLFRIVLNEVERMKGEGLKNEEKLRLNNLNN